ncbi:hypothetical protein JYT31_00980 [Beggiatoa alba]|nr:hypothetical protein [Beggiatoa alba]
MATLVCSACTVPAGQTHAADNTGYSGSTGTDTKNRVTGEYIVTLKPGHKLPAIREVYSAYKITSLKKIGPDRYLIHLQPDPGPEPVKTQGLSSDAIKSVQPNFIYSINPPRKLPFKSH